MRRRVALAAVLALLAPPDPAAAQFSPGARSAGMAGAGMVFARGVDAIEWNPANLARDAGWNVSLGEVGAAGVLGGVTFDEAVDLFDQGSSGQSEAVAGLPAGGLTLSTVSEGFTTNRGLGAGDLPQPGSPLPSIGIAIGNFGIRARSRLMTEARLSKELIDLWANGFDQAEILSYRVGDTGFRTTAFSEITAAYGTTLGTRLGIGVAARYIRGHSLTEAKLFEPVVDLLGENVQITSVAVESPGGNGYALDLGLALDLTAGFRVAASGTNIVQKMTWDDALIAHEATFVGCTTVPGGTECAFDSSLEDDFSETDVDEVVDRFVGTPIDPATMSLEVYQTSLNLFRNAFFPTIFRAGVGWRAGGTALELVGSSVSPRGRQHSQWDERVSLGVEQRLWIFTLRGGGMKGTDGLQSLSAGLGLGIGPVRIDLGGGLMSGGFDLTSSLVAPEEVDYAGGHLTLSIQVMGGGP